MESLNKAKNNISKHASVGFISNRRMLLKIVLVNNDIGVIDQISFRTVEKKKQTEIHKIGLEMQ